MKRVTSLVVTMETAPLTIKANHAVSYGAKNSGA